MLFYQHVTDIVVEKLILDSFQVIEGQECTETSLTYEERNALKYAAGYVIRNLRKRLKRSADPLKDELLQLLDDLVRTPNDADDASEPEDSSSDWLMLIDR